MKNQLFGKVTSLVMGSLVLFSVQGLAISSNNDQEFSNTDTWGESVFIVAQATDKLSPQEQIALSQSIAQVASLLVNLAAVTQAAAIPNPEKIAMTRSLSTASTVLDKLLAQSRSDSLTKSDVAAFANSLSEVESLIRNVIAIASADTQSKDAPAVARAATRALITLAPAQSTTSAHASRGIRR